MIVRMRSKYAAVAAAKRELRGFAAVEQNRVRQLPIALGQNIGIANIVIADALAVDTHGFAQTQMARWPIRSDVIGFAIVDS